MNEGARFRCPNCGTEVEVTQPPSAGAARGAGRGLVCACGTEMAPVQ